MKTSKPLDFLLKNDNMKLCSICGEEKKLSFEHMPPQGTGNNKPVRIYGLENMTPYGGYLHEKFTKSPRGMGGYKLCEDCNKKAGAWYVNSYIDLNNQLMSSIKENLGKKDVELKCNVKPLNFLKQVMCLMLCADQANGQLREIVNAKELMLNKESKVIPEEIYLSMNITVQPTFGFKGFMPSYDNVNGFKNNIEFVYLPFAFFLTLNEDEKGSPESNLTNWKKYECDEEIQIIIPLELKKFKKEDYS